MNEPRIDITVFGKTRRQACRKIASDIMKRNSKYIARGAAELGIEEDDCFDYLAGHQEGIALVLEMMLSGKLDLQEIHRDNPRPEQARGSGGTAD